MTPTIVQFFVQEQLQVKRIAASYDHSLVITHDGSVYSFGKGRYGKLGLAESLLDVENEDDSHLPGVIKDLYLDGSKFSVGNSKFGPRQNMKFVVFQATRIIVLPYLHLDAFLLGGTVVVD